MVARPEELAAGEALSRLLREAGKAVSWAPVPKDPPDLLFHVDGEEWAVEVTGLYRFIWMRGQSQSERAMAKPLQDLCERIKADAEGSGAGLAMGYWISIQGPVRSPSLREVERRALAYIRSGETARRALDDEGRVHIRATRPGFPVVFSIGVHAATPGPEPGTHGGDVDAELRFAVEHALTAKLARFRRLALNPDTSYDRMVLLLTKNYIHAEPDDLRRILAQRAISASELDAVALVYLEPDIYVGDRGDVVNRAGDIHVLATPGRWDLPLQSTLRE